ncbi:hypothetical protein MLD38_021128 [Melastoma candidum]|uniref:Uncharacterized protein n=1 Tax=Melastoma candidum TaxID=119954 RepID=A0ACB9QF62_9MYRT|nr:hypothetical protein MLD38_021128 [Melastoma candidum]
MTKRGYKLQEFVAHSSNVNCLTIGKKACRLFLTGGDDFNVNLWAIGKPNSLMSLGGHTSPVQSVAFDATELLVLGGASSGVIKLWDLEEAKMVRGLTGHRSNCTAVEFHPFGEFFASGSTDTNLKIWDIRKRGCIHTYKGHTRGINTIKFTPDGRWVVSGGCDSIVKVWDLTAGKLLHDFKFHEDHIRTIQFHPLEFLMATGSADRTVKYWDLETFELIGSSRPEGSGVRAGTFNPDGRTFFCGLEDSLKVYSWEPVVCHDTVDMGWSSLGDLCIHEGKLVGCSYYQNSVGVWAADTTLIEPFAKGSTVDQVNLLVSHSPAIVDSGVRCTSPDYEAKEIKNIYVDTSDGKPVSLQLAGSVNSSKMPLLPDLKDNRNLSAQSPRRDNVMASPEKSNGHSKSLVVPFVATPDNSDGMDVAPPTKKDSVSFSRTKPGMLLRPAHSRKPSSTKYSIDRLTVPIESPDFSGTNNISDHHSGQISEPRDTPESTARQSSEGRHPNFKIDSRTMTPIEIPKADKSDEPVAQSRESDSVKIVRGVAVMTGRTRTLVEKFEKRERSNIVEEAGVNTSFHLTSTSDTSHASVVDSVERKDNSTSHESHGVGIPSCTSTTLEGVPPVAPVPLAESSRKRDGSTITPTMDNTPASRADATERKGNSSGAESDQFSLASHMPGTSDKAPLAGNSRRNDGSTIALTTDNTPASRADAMERKGNSSGAESHQVSMPSYMLGTLDKAPLDGISRRKRGSAITPTTHNTPASRADAVERKGNSNGAESHQTSTFSYMPGTLDKAPLAGVSRRKDGSTITPTTDNTPISRADATERKGNLSSMESNRVNESSRMSMTMETVAAVPLAESFKRRGQPTINVQPFVVVHDMPRAAPSSNEKLVHEVRVMDEREPACTVDRPNNMPRNTSIEFVQSNEPQVSGRMESDSETFADVIEVLMQSNEVFLSTMRSRLMKLQAVRHFWERKDIKGAINALERLPDHSVQADVISVLTEKMDILNLDLFSCLLPVLVGLLDSKIERHAALSMEMLMKLVAVFGPVVRSTISACPTVGVDLHAEERLECCTHCWTQLQKTQKILPLLVRKGGLLAKSAQELNLVLQQS